MASGFEKLWQTVLSGLVLAGAGGEPVFGQTSQPTVPQPFPGGSWQQPARPMLMSQSGPRRVSYQPDASGGWQQSPYETQPQYWSQPQYASPQTQQPSQYEPWTPHTSMSPGYVPYTNGGYYGSAAAIGSCPPASNSHERQCYPSAGSAGYREVASGDADRHSNGARRWTESECDCPARPLGASLDAYRNAMRCERQSVGLVLHRYDFWNDSDQLNAKGRQRLAELAAFPASSGMYLVVEYVPDEPRLGEMRRETVVAELLRRSSSISQDRVIVRPVEWPQLRGEEAELVRHRLLKQTTNGGPLTQGSGSRAVR